MIENRNRRLFVNFICAAVGKRDWNFLLKRLVPLVLALFAVLLLCVPSFGAETKNQNLQKKSVEMEKVGTDTQERVSGKTSPKKTIRVAYFELGEYYKEYPNGTMSSYDSEYLSKISEYCDYTFTYVDCKDWANALKMLRANQVDLVGTVQWNAMREERYEYCMEDYGCTVGELAALPEKNYVYEDYEAIGKATVGCTADYVRFSEMKKLFRKHNISPKIKTYETQELLEKALLQGEIDILAANSHAMRSEWTVIEKFLYAPFYFVSRKGNTELTDTIDDAIIRIQLYEPEFDDQLLKKHFPVLMGSPFTREEYDCIAGNEIYTVYFDTNVKPLAWLDKDSGKMQGVLIDICKQLEEKTGLRLEIRPRGEKEETNAYTVDYSTLYYEVEPKANHSEGVTDSIADQTFNLYHFSGSKYKTSGSYKIGVVENRDGLLKYLEEKYPNCEIVEYANPKECLAHLKAKDVDLTFLNTNIAENILISENIEGISEIPISAVTFGIALTFHGENRELLAQIINKGIKLIDDDAVNQSMLQYALNTGPKMTVAYFVRQNFAFVVTLTVFVVLILLALTAIYTYAMVMRKEKQRIEEADHAKSDFFARMSHDMRTPMNGILGMITLTEEAKDFAEVKSNMKKARSSGQYMLSLINDTLDLQRMESGRMQIEPQIVEAKDFIENVIGMVRDSANRKNITLLEYWEREKCHYFIKIDPVRVKQIFTNILSNAIKFTPEGGTIEICIEASGREGERVYSKIRICDTGIGMSPEFIKNNLFKAYSQEKNEMTSKYAGSGLGLAITKNLVDMMGGRIEVESEIGEGTVFTIYLALEKVDNAKAAKSLETKKEENTIHQNELQGKRILLCEDHPLNAEIARRLLEKAGCTVVWAEDGKKGVEEFQKSPLRLYDAILMDIRMPVMNGLDATKAIRTLPREDAKTIPILAMTANAYEEDIRQSIEAGMNEHLAKPIDPENMYAALARQMNA